MSTDVDGIDVGAIEDQGAAPATGAPDAGANGDVIGPKPPKGAQKVKSKPPAKAAKPAHKKGARSTNGKAEVVPSVPAATDQDLPLIFTHPGPLIVKQLMQPALIVSMIGQPVRMAIIGLLMASEAIYVRDLCVLLGNFTQPAVSHHLALLRHCSIVQTKRQGKSVAYSLTEKGRKLAGLLQILLD